MKQGAAASETKQRQLRAFDTEAERQLAEAWETVLATREGRRLVAHFVYDVCGLRRVVAANNAEVYRIEGRRDVGDQLLSECWRYAATSYLQLEGERLRAEAEEMLARGAIKDAEENDDE